VTHDLDSFTVIVQTLVIRRVLGTEHSGDRLNYSEVATVRVVTAYSGYHNTALHVKEKP